MQQITVDVRRVSFSDEVLITMKDNDGHEQTMVLCANIVHMRDLRIPVPSRPFFVDPKLGDKDKG